MRRYRRLRSTTAPPAGLPQTAAPPVIAHRERLTPPAITEAPAGANGPGNDADDASAAAMEAMGDPGDSGHMPRLRTERPRRG
jgi:hypothetical protein